MEKAVDRIVEKFRNKKILIWGFGKEGTSTYNFLRKNFPDMKLDIISKGEINESELTNVEILDYDRLLDVLPNYDIVMKSPGISVLGLDIDKSNLSAQSNMFVEELKKQIIGVTGTKGKSTTTSLIYHVLKSVYDNTVIVGNIGSPPFDELYNIDEETKIVYELSSHQLEFITSSPSIAVVLNFHQDHLDHYGTYEAYIGAKHKIYQFQEEGDILIANPECEGITKENYISVSTSKSADINVYDSSTALEGHEILSKDTNLLGIHNLFNIGVACYICCKLMGLTDEEFKTALKTFNGLAHRMEFVGEVEGVKYYNDSISTIPAATIFAAESIPDVTTVLIGGLDRGIEYEELVDYLITSKVENIILMPDTGERINEMFKGKTNKNISICSDLEEAVKLAKIHTKKGTSCLLSPAAASKNTYKNFEERGNAFKEFVREK